MPFKSSIKALHSDPKIIRLVIIQKFNLSDNYKISLRLPVVAMIVTVLVATMILMDKLSGSREEMVTSKQ